MQEVPGFHSLFHFFPCITALYLGHSIIHILSPLPFEFPYNIRIDMLSIVGDIPVFPCNLVIPYVAHPIACCNYREEWQVQSLSRVPRCVSNLFV